jgi:hypothetical protein
MVEQDTNTRLREIKIIREVNNQAENFYDKAVSLGDHAAKAFKDKHRSQMTNLETLAESALKTTDIFDYIKRQTARDEHWRRSHNPTEGMLGERLRAYLTDNLKKTRDEVCDKLQIGEQSENDQQTRRHIYLQLIRQFIRQMVIEYEYQTSRMQQKQNGNNNQPTQRS